MQEIAELERRITAALERIGRGVANLTTTPPVVESELPVAMAEAELARLTEALDEERMANAQLNERLRVLRDKDGGEKAALQQQVADLTAQLAAQSDEMDELRAQLAAPAANDSGLLDELAALRAARAAEAAEVADIVAALNPLIAEARHDA